MQNSIFINEEIENNDLIHWPIHSRNIFLQLNSYFLYSFLKTISILSNFTIVADQNALTESESTVLLRRFVLFCPDTSLEYMPSSFSSSLKLTQ